MPTHIRAHITWQCGSMLPRDAHQITPCFRHQSLLVEGAPEYDQLAQDLLDIFAGGPSFWVSKPGNQCTVKLYEIKPAVAGQPNRPKATKVKNPATSAEATCFREAALCLSFYGGQNFPTQRGRLYLPYWLWGSASGLTARPAASDRTKVETLVPLLAGLGGVNVDWIVWSHKLQAATKVTNYWVDDEWDIQRRRGNLASARTAGTTSG